MADIYDLNEEPGLPPDAEDFVWIITHYTTGYYEGSGESMGLHTNGRLYFGNLGHCSCYGPCDDRLMDGEGQSVEDFLNSVNIHDYPASNAIYAKAKELLTA